MTFGNSRTFATEINNKIILTDWHVRMFSKNAARLLHLKSYHYTPVQAPKEGDSYL